MNFLQSKSSIIPKASVLPVSFWTSEETLRKSQTKTDKQALRVADYLTVYTDSQGKDSYQQSDFPSSRTVKTDSRLSGTRTRVHTGILPFSVSPKNSTQVLFPSRNISSSTRQRELEESELNSLLQTVGKIASDTLELQRDLATYECRFSRERKIEEKLVQLRNWATLFPSESLDKHKSWEGPVLTDIDAGFRLVQTLEFDGKSGNGKESIEVEKTDFDLRKMTDISVTRILYQGARVISNEHCVLTVRSDGFFRKLRLNCLRMDGQEDRLTVRSDLMEKECMMTRTQIKSAVKSLILPHLYFQSDGPLTVHLQFHEAHAVSFLSLLISLRGLQSSGKTPVQLMEEGDKVHIRLVCGELTLNLTDLTSRKSIFLSQENELAERLTQGLCYIRTERSLVWQSQTSVFHGKESDSPFLDDDFISERLHTLNFQLIFTERFQLESHEFHLECFGHKEFLQLRVTMKEQVYALDHGSDDMRMVLGLQSCDWRNSKLTLLQSLELRSLVKRAFAV